HVVAHTLSRFICLSRTVSFFFHATATTDTYTLSYTTLFRSRRRSHRPRRARTVRDSRSRRRRRRRPRPPRASLCAGRRGSRARRDRKSTRLNSSHVAISYAVFCLKKKKKIIIHQHLALYPS